MSPDPTIADLGEQRLLALLQSFCPAQVVGDDAALLLPTPGHQLVVTTDLLVDGVHFSDRTTPPHAAGWRAVAANLSDLAAMGASGLGITVGLALPPSCPVAWVEQLYQGMVDCLAPYGLAIVGGDVCRSAQRAIAITALGQVQLGQAWRRSTAQVGDAIVATGSHGGARAGLALLLDEAAHYPGLAQLSPAHRAALIRKHQYPQPRLDYPRHCATLQTRITAMDSSDGLADALVQLCRDSGVGARLQTDAIPLPEGLSLTQGTMEVESHPGLIWPLDWALYGGEDFELILCLAPGPAQKLCDDATLTPPARIIGHITPQRGQNSVELIFPDNSIQTLSLKQGFQHF